MSIVGGDTLSIASGNSGLYYLQVGFQFFDSNGNGKIYGYVWDNQIGFIRMSAGGFVYSSNSHIETFTTSGLLIVDDGADLQFKASLVNNFFSTIEQWVGITCNIVKIQ